MAWLRSSEWLAWSSMSSSSPSGLPVESNPLDGFDGIRAASSESLTTSDLTTNDAELLEQVTSEFDAVETALARLDGGSFDACEVCGDRIGSDRLLANPLLTRCGSHG